MRRVLLVAVALIAAIAGLVPATSGAWTASVRNTDSASTARYFGCGGAFSALASSALLQWNLTEPGTTSTARGWNGAGVSGTYLGAHVPTSSTGPGGCAAEWPSIAAFDGVHSWVGSSASALPTGFNTAFSITAWIRTAPGWAGAGDVVLLCQKEATPSGCGSRDFRMYLTSSGTVSLAVAGTAVWAVRTAAAVTDGRWHHVAGTLSSAAGVRLYLDGVDVSATATVTNGSTTTTGTAAQVRTARAVASGWWHVGAGDGGSNWPDHNPTGTGDTAVYFHGQLTGLGIYSRVLGADEIAALAAVGR